MSHEMKPRPIRIHWTENESILAFEYFSYLRWSRSATIAGTIRKGLRKKAASKYWILLVAVVLSIQKQHAPLNLLLISFSVLNAYSCLRVYSCFKAILCRRLIYCSSSSIDSLSLSFSSSSSTSSSLFASLAMFSSCFFESLKLWAFAHLQLCGCVFLEPTCLVFGSNWCSGVWEAVSRFRSVVSTSRYELNTATFSYFNELSRDSRLFTSWHCVAW